MQLYEVNLLPLKKTLLEILELANTDSYRMFKISEDKVLLLNGRDIPIYLVAVTDE